MKRTSKKQESNHVQLPQLNLPKGGGTVRGVEENFHADAFTGTATFGIPFPLPAARALTPSLGAHYSSSAGNGLLGCGFNLSEAAIERKTSRGIPKYKDSDVFLLGGKELVLKDHETTIYLERHQRNFPFIQYNTQQESWTVISGDNVKYTYGKQVSSRIADGNKIYKWLLSEVTDASGNKEVYTYQKLDPNDTNVSYTRILPKLTTYWS